MGYQAPAKHYLTIVIVGFALILQWYSHSSGLIFTADSHHYIAGSHSFRSTLTLVDNAGNGYLFWPPLFPVLLSFLQSPGEGLIWINLILEVCIAFVILKIINRAIQHQGIRLLCFLFILWGVHLLLITTFLWSELFFLFFTVIFIDQLQRSKKSRKALLFAMISGFLMCLQRNSGLFIVVGASIWIFINEERWKQKWLKSSLFFLSVNSGLLAWSVYVWILVPHNHFTFSIELFQHAFRNANSIAQAVINAFLPIDFLSIPILLVSFCALFFFLKDELRENLSLQLIFIVTVSYLILLLLVVIINIAGFPVDFGEGDRFISVIIPLLGILFFKTLEKIFYWQNAKMRILMMALIIVWMSYPISRTIKNAVHWHDVSKEKTQSD